MQSLSRATFSGRGRQGPLWLATWTVVICSASMAAWLLVRPGSHALVTTISNLAQAIGPLLLLPICFCGVRVAARRRGAYLAPLLLGLGVLCFGLGQIIWSFYEQVLHQQSPFPSVADAFFLLQYPFLTIGVLLLPAHRLSVLNRARLLLDGLMAMIAAATFSWYFIVGPTVMQGGESALAKIVGTAYPLWDIVLFAAVLLLLANSKYPMLRRAIGTLAAGLAIIVIADSIFDYQTLHHSFATGGVADLGWVLGNMMICLAGGMAWRALVTRAGKREARVAAMLDAGREEAPAAWRSLLPYALVPAMGALTIYTSQVRGDEHLQPGVYVGAAALLLTIFLRQVLAILENRRLYVRLNVAYWELGTKNAALTEANRRLQTLATTDPLTELPNQRAVNASIEHEVERGRRYGRHTSLLFVDIDHFKKVNDVFGHSAGDEVLREAASIIRQSLRTVDIFGRYGGEEFVAILPEVDRHGATTVAARVREAIASHTFVAASCHLTASVGIASYPDDGDSRAVLVDRADRAMYAAKHLGRVQSRSRAGSPDEPILADGDVALGKTSLAHTVEGLSAMIAGRAHYTSGHTSNVASLAAGLALVMGADESEAATIKLAAKLHDIGKVAVPDAVLLKPGLLNDDEWMLMRRHPIVGADVVGRIDGLGHLAPLIRAHHERWDGVGYPDGLMGDEIPLGARILAVADAFEAMTTGRIYQEAREPHWALSELRRCAGSQFDPKVVDAMERVLESRTPTPIGKSRTG